MSSTARERPATLSARLTAWHIDVQLLAGLLFIWAGRPSSVDEMMGGDGAREMADVELGRSL